MANCHGLFSAFDERIKLTTAKRSSLARSRDALRTKIREDFKERRDIAIPKFHGQGSYMMYTIITPADEDYDVDDGIYFLVDEEPSETIATLHRWICEAVEDHTDQRPIDKNTCVRVCFKAGYHVDLPIYYKTPSEAPRLGHKRDGWVKSDPKEFMDWFNKAADEDGQIKRVVRYFKAWKDYLAGSMPSGLVLSILAAQNIRYHERDDIAMRDTLLAIRDSLSHSFTCYRPTTPSHEDLLADHSDTSREYFMERLDSFTNSANQALNHPGKASACAKWQRHLGPRFACPSEDELDEAEAASSPAFIRSDARSA
jgi:hypothetical protein